MIINPYRYASGSSFLLQDTFTGAAGPLTSHSPEIGGSWSEGDAASGTTFQLTGSGTVGVSTTAQHVAYQDLGAADVVGTIVIGASTTAHGLCVNFVDGSNYWLVAIVPGTAGRFKIFEKTSGSFIERAAVGGSGLTVAPGETLAVTTAGDDISLDYESGSETASYNVASRPHQSATNHGIRIAAPAATIDSVEYTG